MGYKRKTIKTGKERDFFFWEEFLGQALTPPTV
jgi:hypothetical protein